MPCTKCSNGKWRWGSGPCEYDSKAECEADHEGEDSNAATNTATKGIHNA